MTNYPMQQLLEKHEAYDVAIIGKKIDSNTYKLYRFVEGVDYCIAAEERWIWSIGRCRKTGQIFASTTTIYYQNPDFECMWLR